MRNVTISYVTKNISMIFYYAAKRSNKCHEIHVIYHEKFKVVTVKLNVTKYILPKV